MNKKIILILLLIMLILAVVFIVNPPNEMRVLPKTAESSAITKSPTQPLEIEIQIPGSG